MTVHFLQSPRHLRYLLLPVVFKQLQLRTHAVHHLLLLAEQSIKSLLSMLIPPRAGAVVLLIHLNVFKSFASLDFET